MMLSEPLMTPEEYELMLHQYGAGFDEYMIAEVCRTLNCDQIQWFRAYLDEAEMNLVRPN